ncbi:MAG TPA: heptaprenyl diphosphate synthase [Ruminococcaceae bacterium]|nr:heptaprenyl diphosphate synthase [Oscillospiraceae bacterium]
MKISVKKITFMGLLLSLAIVLSFLENMIPQIPMLPPGIKLGLSNIAVMYCLFFMDIGSAFTIALIKSLFVLIARGFVAFLLSLSGGFFSVLIMVAVLYLSRKQSSRLLTSIAGAIAHNIGQIIAAKFIIGSIFVLYYLPVLIISGVFMGIATGVLLRLILPYMNRLKSGIN